jgi:predicted lactoylglutathione lyase
MIGYVTVGSNDLEKSRSFYDALMPTIGASRIMEFGDNFTMYGTAMNRPGLAVVKPHDGNPAACGNGHMTAIACDSRAKVDALHAKAMELGASDEGAPGVRGEEGDRAFYGAYFRDPDGNKLAAFCIGPAQQA